MMEVQVESTAAEFKLRNWRNLLPLHAERGSKSLAQDFQRLVVQNASGRPGPQIVTGAYVASIEVRAARRGFFFIQGWAVVTHHPAARRLEFGYVGVDALGRKYNQPPYPHWRPALFELKMELPAAARHIVRQSWQAA